MAITSLNELRLTQKVRAFIDCHPLRSSLRVELFEDLINAQGAVGVSKFIEGNHVIKLSPQHPKKVFSELFAHEYYHCAQREQGFPLVRAHRLPADETLQGDFRALVTSIRTYPLDLNCNNVLLANGITLDLVRQERYRRLLNTITTKLDHIHSDFIVWRFAIDLVGLYLDLEAGQQNNLMRQIARNKKLSENAYKVIEVTEDCGYSTAFDCARLQGNLLSMYGLWDMVNIVTDETAITSYEAIHNHQWRCADDHT